LAQIIIRKGHDIQIAGVPKKEVAIPLQPISIALHPTEFKYIKPKLLIKEGDHVKIGSPLFYDKCNPDIRWASPATGDIAAVHYGPRRSIQKILIKLDKHEESLEFKRFDSEAILSSSREIIIDHILSAGLWPVIRQRPFNKVANPKETPSSIFISCVNSAPLTADLDLVMRNKQATFHAGINALSRITDGQVNVVVGDTSTSETFMDIPHAETHSITGPHPAGNVGIQIHHIDPLKPGKLIWTVDAQFVLTLGTLFLKGVFDPGIVVAVGGPGVKNPIHFQSRIGAAVKSLVKDRLKDGNYRLISGDVLTGETIDWDDHLHFYHTCVSIIPESDKREFLGFLRPGSSKTRYSLTNAFLFFSSSLISFYNITKW